MIAVIAAVAAAQDGAGIAVRSETVAELRHDLFGEAEVPLYQFLHVTSDGAVAVDGYLGLSANPTRGDLGLAVYALSASGRLAGATWRVGSQQGETALRPATFDGLWVAAPLGRRMVWISWGGWARHSDLGVDAFTAGLPVARSELRSVGGPIAAVVGAQLEAAQPDLVAREDASVRLGDMYGRSASALVALAETVGGSVGLERARGELATRIAPGWSGSTWAERRKTEVETLLADDILPVFAPEGVDEVGVRLRAVGPRLASASASYAIGRAVGELAVGPPALTHRVDVGWTAGPSRPAWPAFAWRWRSGSGGAYHALSVNEAVALSDRTAARATAALVPYRRGSDPWRLAFAGGGELEERLGGTSAVQVGADLSTDAVWALDVRAHAALTLEWR